MKKIFGALFAATVLLLTGCSGTTVVYYDECGCSDGGTQNTIPDNTDPPDTSAALKTGLAVITDLSGSKSATAADYNVTIVAVTVDDGGVIEQCLIDGIAAQLPFDSSGTLTGDLSASVPTKNELGEDYGMKAYGGAKYEWYEQAAALARYAEGKTVEELLRGAVDDSGYAAPADLAATATIRLDGLVAAIAQAADRAQHRGAQRGDRLRLAVISSLDSSSSATSDTLGTAQLDSDIAAITRRGDVITSCHIDSLQAKVAFDATGAITSDITTPAPTKNELAEDYGMKAYGGAKYEWYEQAAAFSRYVTGKTGAEVAGIAVTEGKAAEADLAASVTIGITGFQALVAKAMA